MFAMYKLALLEVFWEVSGKFVEISGSLFDTFRFNLITERTSLFAAAIHQNGTLVDTFTGFITSLSSCHFTQLA